MQWTLSALWIRHTLLMCFAVPLLAAGAAGAQANEAERRVLMPWEQETEVLRAAPPTAVARGPVHGVLTYDEEGDLLYRPWSSSFWDVGSDAFLLEYSNSNGETQRQRFVVHAGVQETRWAQFGFEPSELEPPEIDPAEQLGVDSAAALLGEQGARIELDGSGSDAYYRIPIPVSPPGRGGPPPADPGCADMHMDLSSGDPDGGDGLYREALEACLSTQDGLYACRFTLLRIAGDQSDIARVQVAMSEDATWIRGVFFDDLGQQHSTAWIPLEDQPYTLRTDWWTDDVGGIRLWLDGRVVASTVGHSSGQESRAVEIGAIDAPVEARLAFSLDSIHLYHGAVGQGATASLSDPFETDLSKWTAMGLGGGSLRIDSSAALAGGAGLEIGLGAGWGSWLRDDTPEAVRNAGLRFLVDASDLDLGPAPSDPTSGPVFGLVHGLKLDDGGPGSAFSLRLWRSSTGFRIQASAANDDGSFGRTPYAPSSDVHVVDLRWKAATEPGRRDGWLRFWLDGDLVGEATRLDNAQAVMESVRLGALNLPDEAAGLLRFDEYEVLRVGPLPE
ncbi:MAG: hypothetical protein MPN21_00895 [Thermoanaerobaculia bacterium]|nr:hypothetical protein [Thermoanaerobaculia bacterium]